MRNSITAIAAILVASAASAAPTVYFGENTNPAFTVSGAPVTARSSFLAQLSGVSTQNFDGFAVGSSPAAISFTGSAGTINAAFGGGVIENNAGDAGSGGTGVGRFATSGSNYYETQSGLTITFSEAIAAFGFYGVDIGDFNGQLGVSLTSASGITSVLVPHSLPANNGSLLFFGVIDTANPFTSVTFTTTSSADYFGFDDLTIGDINQVTPEVPEPATWAMFIGGFGAIGGALRRRRLAVAFT